MNIQRALATDGWMEPVELEYLASLAQRSRVIVELGSWKGRSTLALAQNTNGVVFAVDVWEDNPLGPMGTGMRGSIFAEFQENTRGLANIIPIVATTANAFEAMKIAGIRPDLIFIDACHEYEAVREDILNWRSLLTPFYLLTGEHVLCGHDFVGDYPGVAKAVTELVPEFRLVNSIWTTEGA